MKEKGLDLKSGRSKCESWFLPLTVLGLLRYYLIILCISCVFYKLRSVDDSCMGWRDGLVIKNACLSCQHTLTQTHINRLRASSTSYNRHPLTLRTFKSKDDCNYYLAFIAICACNRHLKVRLKIKLCHAVEMLLT